MGIWSENWAKWGIIRTVGRMHMGKALETLRRPIEKGVRVSFSAWEN
jgi:hypothetical protein